MATAHHERIVLGYVRVSTDRQVERGRSLDDQRRRLKQYVRDKFALELGDDGIYADAGASGGLTVRQLPFGEGPVRENLSDLVDRCIKGEVDALVIDTLDRLARDIFVCYGIQRLLEPYGTSVIVADGDLDFTNPGDEMLIGFHALLSQVELSKMRHRSTRGQAERRAAGYPPWGKIAFGWRWLTDEEFRASCEPFRGIARVDPEAEWVAWIFDQYLRRGRVILDICEELNDRKTPFRDSEVEWQSWRVREVLGNFTHAGLVMDNEGEPKPGAHFEQRIIDPDDWHRVQDLRRERSTRGPRALSQRDAPLLGIARCGACGQRLQLHRDRDKTLYYVCPRPQEGEDRVCPGLSKRADVIETVVADFIRHTAAAPKLRAMIEDEASVRLTEHRDTIRTRRDELEAELQEMDSRLERAAERLTDGTLSAEAFAHIDRTWRDDRQSAEAELAETEQKLDAGDAEERRVQRVMDALDAFTQTWERLQAPQIRQLLMSMVQELIVRPHEDGAATVRLTCYYMPEMTQHIPHLSRAVGCDDERLASLTRADLAFLALWAKGMSVPEIDKARGMKCGSSYSRVHLIRQRTGIRDLDALARLAAPLIEQYRLLLPTDCKCAEFDRVPDLEPTDRQLEVARLLADGMTYTEVAERLGPTPSTIRRHMCALRERLGAETNPRALMLLTQQGRL